MSGEQKGSGQGSSAAIGASGVQLTEERCEALYTQEAEKLLNFFVRRVGREAADGLCQETWMQAFAWWRDHPEHPAPAALLYKIARCRAVDHLKQDGRMLPVEGENLEELAAALADRRDVYADADARIDLHRALKSLTKAQRQALQLHHIDGLTVAECAAVMGTGQDNVKKSLKTAKRRLTESPELDSYQLTAATAPQEVGT
ncbi:RNA polymerase sigma factor [Streptomyces sp. NPDC001380]|uniref:RNA polymerase sigma factor n=1 Tax=Streptomyces sp. NPDC001380 TaxID=3364566 RepID=UPI0036BD6A0C